MSENWKHKKARLAWTVLCLQKTFLRLDTLSIIIFVTYIFKVFNICHIFYLKFKQLNSLSFYSYYSLSYKRRAVEEKVPLWAHHNPPTQSYTSAAVRLAIQPASQWFTTHPHTPLHTFLPTYPPLPLQAACITKRAAHSDLYASWPQRKHHKTITDRATRGHWCVTLPWEVTQERSQIHNL